MAGADNFDFRAPADMASSLAVRRMPHYRRMVASAVGTAADVIGRIEPGVEITGLTNGQFSLIDVLEHLLVEVGPADVAVATWTMGIYDQQRAAEFYRNGLMRRCRWLVDPSMFSRRLELAGTLVERFGGDSFRAVNIHAKFATVVGNRLQVVVRSSMNLNPNKRVESFDVTEGPELVGLFNGFVDDVFSRVLATVDGQVTQSRRFFADILTAMETCQQEVEAAGPFSGLGELGAGLQEWRFD